MGDRALERRLSGDPIEELDRNTAQGNYRFLGLADWDAKRQWVPGVPDGHPSHVEYLTTNSQATWTSSAEQYFARYNKTLIPRRKGKKLDKFGTLVQ